MSVATIGSALAEKRRELGLEKGQAADKIGMSRTTYSSYEQDAQRPSVDVFPALANFLEISMEELLALYGATCVAAVRPSLERLLSDSAGESKEEPEPTSSSDGSIDTDGSHANSEAPTRREIVLELQEVTTNPDFQHEEHSSSTEPDASEDRADSDSNSTESASEVALELDEATTGPDSHDRDQHPDSLTEPDASEDRADSDSNSTESASEVALELDEVKTEPRTVEQVSDAEGLGKSDHASGSTASVWHDPPSSPSGRSVESVVFEPSPYFIKTSLSDAKKKKKKKKKKK